MNDVDSGYDRLEQQISWYDKKSGAAQRNFKLTKYFTIFASATIPVVALYGLNEVAALLGAMIAILEGVSQVNQWQHNWITYRSTCEALRHEKYVYMERADPYDIEDDRRARKQLVERVESLISTEHSKWIAVQDSQPKAIDDKKV
jgi:hypothetical protein